jgi:hypothetical protein
MPGSAIITALVHITNPHILNSKKPRSYTFDNDIIFSMMSMDEEGVWQSLTAVSHFFSLPGQELPASGATYFMVGKLKVTSINPKVENNNIGIMDAYDIHIDTFEVS